MGVRELAVAGRSAEPRGGEKVGCRGGSVDLWEGREACEEAAVRRMSVGRKSETSASGGSESEESESSSMRACWDIVGEVGRRRSKG